MKTIRYTTTVDADVRYSQTQFDFEVDVYLHSPDGWESQGYTFERSNRPDIEIHLSSPATTKRVGCSESLSCAELGGKHMYLNAMRWTSGSKESRLSLSDYRQYMVSHEMGHILGHDHETCGGAGQPAPIMMQQTLGIGECSPNTKVAQSGFRSHADFSSRSLSKPSR